MNDPWANRHPEWAQDDAAAIRRQQRTRELRLKLGMAFFALIALGMTVIALRDRLPVGW